MLVRVAFGVLLIVITANGCDGRARNTELATLRKVAEANDAGSREKVMDELAKRIQVGMSISDVQEVLGKLPDSHIGKNEDYRVYTFSYPPAHKTPDHEIGWRIRIWCSAVGPYLVREVEILQVRPVFKSTKEIPFVPTDLD